LMGMSCCTFKSMARVSRHRHGSEPRFTILRSHTSALRPLVSARVN
jgi:hypothetical protein